MVVAVAHARLIVRRTHHRGGLASAKAQTPKTKLPPKVLPGEPGVPFACQIRRGTTGNSGAGRGRRHSLNAAPPQVSTAATATEPEPPKLKAPVHRHGLAATACSGRRHGSVAEAGGGGEATAPHRRG